MPYNFRTLLKASRILSATASSGFLLSRVCRLESRDWGVPGSELEDSEVPNNISGRTTERPE
jgi:hypothetical protein